MRASARGLLFVAVTASMLFGGCAERHGAGVSLKALGVASAADPAVQEDYGEPDPPSGLGSYLAGRHAEQEFDLPAALELQKHALEEDPENTSLKQRVMTLSVYAGQIADSVELAEELANEGNNPLASTVLAVEAARKNDWAGAQKRLEELPPRGLYGLLRNSGIAWAQFIQQGPDAALGMLPTGDGRNASPIAQIDAALIEDVGKRVDRAREAWERVLAGSAPSLRITQLAGNFFERNGDAARATGLYNALRNATTRTTVLLPQTPRPVPEPLIADARDGLAETLLTLGAALNEQRDGSAGGSGLGFSRLALYLSPKNSMAAMLTAEMLENREQRSEVGPLLSAVPPDDMLYKAAQLRLATSLNIIEKTDEAAAALRKLGDRWQEDPEPYLMLGDIYRARERFPDAVVAYDEALKRLGTLQRQHWRVLYYRGIALERSGDWSRAEADFKQALAFDGEQASVLNYLGYSWIDRGVNLREGEAMIRKAVELRPEDGAIVDSLGWAYYQTGRFAEAVVELEKAVALEPSDPTINEHLGDAYWKVGRRAEAHFQWNRALRLDPEKDKIAGIEAKLSCGLAPDCKPPAKGG